MKVVAHRYLSRGNTRAAMAKVGELEGFADVVEADLRVIGDGNIVLLHDLLLFFYWSLRRRVLPKNWNIRKLCLEELDAFLVGNGYEPAVTLQELFETYSWQIPVLFDIKGREIPENLAQVLRANRDKPFTLGVRSYEALQTACPIVKWSKARVLGFTPRPIANKAFADGGAGAVRLWPREVTAEVISEYFALGAETWITLGGFAREGMAFRYQVRRLQKLGVHGVILNDPHMAFDRAGRRLC